MPFSRVSFALWVALATCPAAPAAAPAALVAADESSLPAVYVVGDSTAHNNNARGWGDQFAAYFDLGRIRVINRAIAGRSSRTFQTEGHWERLLAELKRGDFVLIQFGHNDGGPLDTGRARGSLPGLGDETREITRPDGNTEVVHTYGWYMRKFIADTRAKGATPIVLSLTVRNIWKEGKVERGSGRFGAWSAEIARTQRSAFVDVTNIIADRYEAIGEQKMKDFFPEDYAHTSPAGAELTAALVLAGIKGLKSCALAKYVSPKGEAVAPDPLRAVDAPESGYPMQEPASSRLPSLIVIGDSTVRNGRGDGSNGQWGWGDLLAGFFEPSAINIVNRALGGTSSRTYFNRGHWERAAALIKPGDFVMMQFGHNDSGPLDDAARARGTLPGIGDETREIENPITGQHEVVHTYGWYLRQFITETRAKGATPIVCSLVPRKTWRDGKIARGGADGFAGWARGVAQSEAVAFIDLNEIIARRYDQLGPEKVEPLFADPQTHTSRAGAELNAECVILGLKALEKNPLDKYFSSKAIQIKP